MAGNLKAIGLISGGLDSSLAIKAIQLQGIEVIAVHFLIPFVKYDAKSTEESSAQKIARNLGCKLKIIELKDDYLKMVKTPRHGYGKNLNPCIDCKIFMLQRAKEIMRSSAAKFIFTGEVIGQRPMSQTKRSLRKIEEESSLKGLLVRPLSAKFLPQTIPQKEGWLKEELLFDIHGRGRKRQIALARKWKIKEYPWPGGGCLLTDPSFCKRLKELIAHNEYSYENIELLKVGRHFRLSKDFKFIVGRDQKDNEKIIQLAKKNDALFLPANRVPGPVGLGKGVMNEKIKELCASIIARYTKAKSQVEVSFNIIGNKKKDTLIASSIDHTHLKKFII